tara:strand:- start:619 stop:918 length:300 start_codon:yes stop_codon:yes gene_type:complete
MDFTDEQIKTALKRYQKNREYQRNYYRNKYQNDINYREKSKELSKNYYYNNIEKKKEKYNLQKEFLQAQRRFRYWKNKNDIDTFIKKYPDDYNNYFKDF